MKRFCFIFLCALLAHVAVAAAQDTQATPASPASDLPPIFAAGNRVTLAGPSVISTITIVDVRGDWILANVPGQGKVWMRPASMQGTWSFTR